MTGESLVSLLDGVKRTPRGWLSKCPAHGDTSPSLSIRHADDGRILLHCFAGCRIHEICSALHVEIRDLFPLADRDPHHIRAAQQRRQQAIQERERSQRLKDATADARREAQHLIESAKSLSIMSWSDAFLNAALDKVASAHELVWPDVLEGLNEPA